MCAVCRIMQIFHWILWSSCVDIPMCCIYEGLLREARTMTSLRYPVSRRGVPDLQHAVVKSYSSLLLTQTQLLGISRRENCKEIMFWKTARRSPGPGKASYSTFELGMLSLNNASTSSSSVHPDGYNPCITNGTSAHPFPANTPFLSAKFLWATFPCRFCWPPRLWFAVLSFRQRSQSVQSPDSPRFSRVFKRSIVRYTKLVASCILLPFYFVPAHEGMMELLGWITEGHGTWDGARQKLQCRCYVYIEAAVKR
jgi:hypothetical protein